MNLAQRLSSELWAIRENALQLLLSTQITVNEQQTFTDNSSAQSSTSVAIIPIRGPLFRYANPLTQMLGLASYEQLQQALHVAVSDTAINSIILNIDSPGGEVHGCSELAKSIVQARSTKPIVAYVSGDAASGAYWLASACEQIVIADTAALGSIGVVAVYPQQTTDDNESPAVEIVSSQSPYKRLDVKQDGHRQRLQQRIDQLAQIFIESIAQNRNVSADTVINDFGRGDVLIGQQAVDNGLADHISSLEQVIQVIANNSTNKTLTTITEDNHIMKLKTIEDLQAQAPELTAELMMQASTQERERMAAILNGDAAKDRETLARHLAFDTAMTADQAVAVLQAAPTVTPHVAEPVKAEFANHTGFEQVMASIANPAIEPNQDDSEEDLNTIAQRLASY